jgi:release factor glutamine methyltransferase
MTLREALLEAEGRIARRDAEVLLGHTLRRNHAWLLAHDSEALSEAEAAAFFGNVARREAREPLQYITGVQEFYGLPMQVTRDTLIPRPETEHLVEAVIGWAATRERPLHILDVGTGTGAIAIALAHHLKDAAVTACDLSAAVLAVAAENARENRVAVRFVVSDLLAAFAHEQAAGFRFDAIVSNPPYVPTGDAAEMQPEVRDYEPHSALFAGSDGLDIYRRLIVEARNLLMPGGLLAMEMGFGQSEPLRALLDGWKDVRFLDDYAGIARVALAENGD